MMKKRVIMLLTVIIIVSCVCSIAFKLHLKEEAPLRVAIVTKSSQSNFWKEFFKGVQAGATEYNITFTFEAPDNEEDITAQNKMLKKAIDERVDVIVFSAISATESNGILEEAKQKGIYIIMADSGVSAECIDAWIGSDNYGAGEQMADAVSSMKIDEIKVGIVNFDASSANGQEREKGFRDAAAKDKRIEVVDAVHAASNVTSSKNATLEMLEEHPEMNVVVTMNEWTTLGVGYAIEESKCAGGVQVYGFDSNIFCIDMLERGSIDGLIVQNPYAMGYMSIAKAYHLKKEKQLEEENLYTRTTLVTRENMYEPDVQKNIFPIEVGADR